MTNNQNILMVANWQSDVGYAWWLMENFWASIANHFSSKGIKCYLIYPEIKDIPGVISNADLQVHELDFNNRSLDNLRTIKQFISEHGIGHLYLTDRDYYSLFYAALRRWGINTIVIHDHTPGDRTTPSAIKRSVKSLLQRNRAITADKYIAVSTFVLRRLIDVACIPGDKCVCVPNGIVPVDIDSADPDYAYRQFGIPNDRTIVVTTGRATFYKGIDFFIECANYTVNKLGRRDIHFLYCGTGPDIKHFESMVSGYKLSDYFTFAGHRTDIRKILPGCDMAIHAATGEVGYSLSILEYMSAGLITLVPDTPSTSAATENGVDGFVYRYRDAESAVTTGLSAMGIETRRKIRANAIDKIRNQYNIADTNRALISALAQVFTPQT